MKPRITGDRFEWECGGIPVTYTTGASYVYDYRIAISVDVLHPSKSKTVRQIKRISEVFQMPPMFHSGEIRVRIMRDTYEYLNK